MANHGLVSDLFQVVRTRTQALGWAESRHTEARGGSVKRDVNTRLRSPCVPAGFPGSPRGRGDA
jgi:hypothetical protein